MQYDAMYGQNIVIVLCCIIWSKHDTTTPGNAMHTMYCMVMHSSVWSRSV
jgi:hypothetical protein